MTTTYAEGDRVTVTTHIEWRGSDTHSRVGSITQVDTRTATATIYCVLLDGDPAPAAVQLFADEITPAGAL